MKFQEVITKRLTLLAQGYEQPLLQKQSKTCYGFTDETSYSFTEMMNNMSNLQLLGIGLEAQESMMGIANWAALSGQNAGTASRVMYQLSQAMGSGGVIKLQDWKSIETANMATKRI